MKEKLREYVFEEWCSSFLPVLAESVPNHTEVVLVVHDGPAPY